MKFVPYETYERFAKKIAEKPFNGKYSGKGGKIFKRHPGQIWRPIAWCDKCKADITGGVVLDVQDDSALCSECGGFDKEVAASLGILID